MDLIELNEAFAAQALAVIKVLGIDPAKVNVNGGAIALGHPLGCTGAKLTATLLREMPRRKAKYGMVTMCVGGGMGAAGIFEADDQVNGQIGTIRSWRSTNVIGCDNSSRLRCGSLWEWLLSSAGFGFGMVACWPIFQSLLV